MVVLSTVGGVVAFKAKRNLGYCTTATTNGACPSTVKCTNGTVLRFHASGDLKCYFITMNTANCATDKPTCELTPTKLVNQP